MTASSGTKSSAQKKEIEKMNAAMMKLVETEVIWNLLISFYQIEFFFFFLQGTSSQSFEYVPLQRKSVMFGTTLICAG